MSADAAEGPVFEARLWRRVHPGLTLDIALSLGRECGVVFGRSGAGKTTLLRLIAGLDSPDGGRVRLDGEVLFDHDTHLRRPLRARRIAMVFQDDLLFPHLTAAGNIRFGLKGMSRTAADQRVAEVAALCGVGNLLDRRPTNLSGGERQRVGLARALAPRPRLLLCDEPVSALDLDGRRALVERLRAVQQAEALPVLYVTHSPAEAVALGHTMFLLDGGRIVAEGPPLDVLAAARPGTRSQVRLEGVRNVFPAVVADHSPDGGETRLRLNDGPTLIVPRLRHEPGEAVVVSVLAEEILLARDPVSGLSARNMIPGTVERVLTHGHEAEVVVRTGALRWVVSVVSPAVDALQLNSHFSVHMIIKARSCQVVDS